MHLNLMLYPLSLLLCHSTLTVKYLQSTLYGAEYCTIQRQCIHYMVQSTVQYRDNVYIIWCRVLYNTETMYTLYGAEYCTIQRQCIHYMVQSTVQYRDNVYIIWCRVLYNTETMYTLYGAEYCTIQRQCATNRGAPPTWHYNTLRSLCMYGDAVQPVYYTNFYRMAYTFQRPTVEDLVVSYSH